MEKENSLKKKDGWKEYSQRSWVLIPKINGRTIDSILVYGISAALIFWMYNNGGMKASLILLK